MCVGHHQDGPQESRPSRDKQPGFGGRHPGVTRGHAPEYFRGRPWTHRASDSAPREARGCSGSGSLPLFVPGAARLRPPGLSTAVGSLRAGLGAGPCVIVGLEWGRGPGPGLCPRMLWSSGAPRGALSSYSYPTDSEKAPFEIYFGNYKTKN